MDRKKFRECKALLFDFGGTIDADGEQWLDRFFALYEDGGLDFQQEEIKSRLHLSADGPSARPTRRTLDRASGPSCIATSIISSRH